MNTPDFSIVIPVYKTEQYLADCINSILCQKTSPPYWELILVDNASPDNCGAICDEYAAKDERIRVIHLTENVGPSGARNVGLRDAVGEYVLFVDSDDLVEPIWMETLMELAASHSDVLTFSYYVASPKMDSKELHRLPVVPHGETGKEWTEECFSVSSFYPSAPWVYAYRRAFLNEHQLSYREDLKGPEDFDLNIRVMSCAQSVSGTEKALYVWKEYPNSLSQKLAKDSYSRFLAELPVFAEYYRQNPHPMFARAFADHTAIVGNFPKKDSAQALEFIRQNSDIYQHVPHSFQRILVVLIRIFGIYRGAWIFTKLRQFKNSHKITRKIHWPPRPL